VGYPRCSSILLGLIVAQSAVRPLGAQRRSTIDVGLAAVEFPVDSAHAFGPFLSWAVLKDVPRYFLSGSAGGVFAPGGPSGSVQAAAGRRTSLPGGWTGEGSAELGAVSGPIGRTGTSGLGAVRLLRTLVNSGGWLRLSGNVASRDAGWLGGEGVDVGAWWRWPRIQLSTSLSQQWNVAQLFAGPSRRDVIGTVPVTYTEAAVGLRVEGDESSLEVSAGVRRDRDAPQLYQPALSATAAIWQSANRAVVISVARQLADFVHGADAINYISVGLRFNHPTPRAEREERTRPTVLVSGADSLRQVHVRAPGARTVEILGDFTNWEPVRLTPQNGVFSARVALSSGSHRMLVRLDGGEWRPAANTPAVNDDLGGRVGLLLVP